jgi:hypothetical protein
MPRFRLHLLPRADLVSTARALGGRAPHAIFTQLVHSSVADWESADIACCFHQHLGGENIRFVLRATIEYKRFAQVPDAIAPVLIFGVSAELEATRCTLSPTPPFRFMAAIEADAVVSRCCRTSPPRCCTNLIFKTPAESALCIAVGRWLAAGARARPVRRNHRDRRAELAT